MKKTHLLLFLFFFSLEVFSQQDPQFAQNMNNLLFTNPAFAGMSDGICASAINRQQWVGFKGAPVTTLAGIHSKIKLFGIKGGVGLSIADDRYEFSKDFQAKLAYSYHRRFMSGILGIGIEAGMINKDLEPEWIYPDEDGQTDGYIPHVATRKMILDLGLGIFYKLGENFYAGISMSHIHKPKIKYPELSSASFLSRHYFATVGYNFRMLNSPIEMQPSVFVKFDGTKMQYSGNLTALYNKKFSLGVSYRNKEAIIPMIGINLFSGLKIGYAYELSINRLITVSRGTHEFFVGYCFNFFGTTKDYKYRSIIYL